MGLRDWINRNSTVATLVVAAVLVVAAGAVAMQLRGSGPARAGHVYFWDLERDEAFVERDQLAPIDAPSGGIGVRAHLFTCGECTADEWLGYLERYTDEAAPILRGEEPYAGEGGDPWDDLRFVRENHLVRSLDDSRWVIHDSREGARIREAVREACGEGVHPERCRPQ